MSYNPTDATLSECQHFCISTWSDLHKDAYGFRPRHVDLSELTAEGLDALWERTVKDLEETMRIEKEAELEAENQFTDRLYAVMEQYNIDAPTALRWMGIRKCWHDGWSGVCFENGLPYSYAEQLDILAAA